MLRFWGHKPELSFLNIQHWDAFVGLFDERALDYNGPHIMDYLYDIVFDLYIFPTLQTALTLIKRYSSW